MIGRRWGWEWVRRGGWRGGGGGGGSPGGCVGDGDDCVQRYPHRFRREEECMGVGGSQTDEGDEGDGAHVG